MDGLACLARIEVLVKPFKGYLGTVESTDANVHVRLDTGERYVFYHNQVRSLTVGDDRPAPNGDAWERQMLGLLMRTGGRNDG